MMILIIINGHLIVLTVFEKSTCPYCNVDNMSINCAALVPVGTLCQ